MREIKELVIVEGQHDINRIKEKLNVNVIACGGFRIKKETINLIKRAARERGVIILTDSDSAGKLIRSKISKFIKGEKIKHAFLREKNKEVESEDSREIVKILKEHSSYEERERNFKININDLRELGLSGKDKSGKIREQLCKNLNLGLCNSKKLVERLNYFNISLSDLKSELERVLKS